VSLYSSLLSPELNFHPARLKSENFFRLFFSSAYAFHFGQLLSFQIDPNTPRGCLPLFAIPTDSPLPTAHYPLSAFFSAVCRLFVPVAKLNSRVFKRMRTLSQKMPGWPTTGDCRPSRINAIGRRASSFVFRVSIFVLRDVQMRSLHPEWGYGTFGRSDVQTFRRKTFRRRKEVHRPPQC
jgi:hypothetical protein